MNDPYEIVYAAQIADQPAALPPAARHALHTALRAIAADPWRSHRYHPRMPEEMRATTFGEWGVLVFVVSEKHHRVIVSHITWA